MIGRRYSASSTYTGRFTQKSREVRLGSPTKVPALARGLGLRLELGIGLASIASMCDSMCGGPHMATNLSIDPELIERALALSGERTKKAAVTKALEEFIARRRQKRVLELFGKLEWDAPTTTRVSASASEPFVGTSVWGGLAGRAEIGCWLECAPLAGQA